MVVATVWPIGVAAVVAAVVVVLLLVVLLLCRSVLMAARL